MSKALVCIFSILFLFIEVVQAAEYKDSLANMPVYAESTEKGILVDFTKALSKASGVPISIVVEPFPRSINNVTQAKTADFACDPILKAKNLENVKRTLYKRFDVKVVLPEGGKGGPVDKFLTGAIDKLKASGEFAKILDPVNTEFDPWQM